MKPDSIMQAHKPLRVCASKGTASTAVLPCSTDRRDSSCPSLLESCQIDSLRGLERCAFDHPVYDGLSSVTPHGLPHSHIAPISKAQCRCLTEREAQGGIDSAHIDMFPSRAFGSSNGEMDDGEADNAARHGAMPVWWAPLSPAGSRGLHSTRAQGTMGLAWNLRSLPHRVRSPQPRTAIRDKILIFPFLGQRSEAGMGGGGCRDQAGLRRLLILPANGTEDLDIHNALMYSTIDPWS